MTAENPTFSGDGVEEGNCPVCHGEYSGVVAANQCKSIDTPSVNKVCVHSHTFPPKVYFHQVGDGEE